MMLALTVFISMFLADVCWTFYIRRATDGNSFHAAKWAVFLYLTGIIGTLSVVHNPWLIIPAVLGCFFGTYAAVYLDKKKAENGSK